MKVTFPTWRAALFFYVVGVARSKNESIGMTLTGDAMHSYIDKNPEIEEVHKSVRPSVTPGPRDMASIYRILSNDLRLLTQRLDAKPPDKKYYLTWRGFELWQQMNSDTWRSWPVVTTQVVSPLKDGSKWR